ncbi:AAA family ATPase [Methylosinus sp. R-45379]|uniref:AAA family ATPase n=1 Tax=Methylosinus sp. R-45379 TaxID=980563 RepID=UPI000A00B34E|nr:ATP-binding protein [Methylosinus sp. R-45379]
MSISSVSENEFRTIIRENFTPSEEIRTPERLFGREKNMRLIDRALNSPGRQIFICGDRGVGKTSLAVTAAHLYAASQSAPIYVPCGKNTTFAAAIHAIGTQTIDIRERIERPTTGRSFSLNIVGFGGGVSTGAGGDVVIPVPKTIDEALDVIRYVARKRQGQVIIVIDEMERIESKGERELFAEFIKNIPTIDRDVRFIFCGIASDIHDLLNSHPSAGRILETIRLEKLHHDFLWQIVTTVAEKVDVSIDREMLIRIGQISDGFPHFVHLIGDTLFWNIFDDPEDVKVAKQEHFRAGITGALERSDAVLRGQYQKATQKTKNTDDYEEALWALADTNSDMRQLQEIYDASYSKIMLRRTGRYALPRETFNQRLLTLRNDGHGCILVGHGAGWFSFRENIMRGYVRLRAEQKGISIGRG